MVWQRLCVGIQASTWTPKEFSHLLDMTLEEAKQVGIDPEAVKLGLLDDKTY